MMDEALNAVVTKLGFQIQNKKNTYLQNCQQASEKHLLCLQSFGTRPGRDCCVQCHDNDNKVMIISVVINSDNMMV